VGSFFISEHSSGSRDIEMKGGRQKFRMKAPHPTKEKVPKDVWAAKKVFDEILCN